MMGHINNLLIRMVEKHHGADGVSRLFALAGISRKQYQPEVVYSEEEFQALYKAAKELYGVGDEAAQKAFSDYFMEVSPVMFPAIFLKHGSSSNTTRPTTFAASCALWPKGSWRTIARRERSWRPSVRSKGHRGAKSRSASEHPDPLS